MRCKMAVFSTSFHTACYSAYDGFCTASSVMHMKAFFHSRQYGSRMPLHLDDVILVRFMNFTEFIAARFSVTV